MKYSSDNTVDQTEERRIGGRFKLDVATQCESVYLESKHILKCQDLSFRGARLFVKRDLPLEADIGLSFDLPACGDQFRAKGKVCWKKSDKEYYDIGIHFSSVSESDKEKLYCYIFKRHKAELIKYWWQGLK